VERYTNICPLCGERNADEYSCFNVVCEKCRDNLCEEFTTALDTVLSTYSFNSDELEALKCIIFETKDLVPEMEEVFAKAVKEQRELEEAEKVFE
jgi:hypothetical protein